jgi:RNA polymerase-binding protein DksA
LPKRTLAPRTLAALARDLEARRAAAAENAEALMEEAREAQQTLDVSDRLDAASPVAPAGEESFALAMRAAAKVADIDRALERIEAGTYGSCTVCGADIPYERLRALPTAETCVACGSAGRRSPGAAA